MRIVTDLDDLAQATFLVEAVVEHHGLKADGLAELGELARHAGADAVLATTTSSLPVSALAAASGRPERFVGLHVFNPVTKMQLVELVRRLAICRRALGHPLAGVEHGRVVATTKRLADLVQG